MRLTRGQRAALMLAAGARLVLLIGGGLSYMREEGDPFCGLSPIPPFAPPVAYSASSPP